MKRTKDKIYGFSGIIDIIFTLILIPLFVLTACADRGPEVAETGPFQEPDEMPYLAPNDWILAHVDVETTGLIPGYHEMIDIGLVYTDLDGELIDSLFLRIQPEHPERLSPGAFAVNAFDPDKWESLNALSPITALDSLVEFHNRVAMNRTALMVAHNSHFDSAFLDHLFRSAGRTWRELFYYYILDIPSMAWGLGFQDLTTSEVMSLYEVADEPHVAELHTGITGAMKNVRVYRALLKHQARFKRIPNKK